MSRAAVAAAIRAHRVIAVVRAGSADEALALCEAIHAGGVRLFEITLTVPDAIAAIGRAAQSLGDGAIVGAGSVLDSGAAHACIDAGARFVVCPVLEPALVAACHLRDVVGMPGALTPTEILAAHRAGADFVKVFPASAVGGAPYVRAVRAPLPDLALVPTGGVMAANAAAFLDAGAAAVGAGSELADLAALRRGDAAAITRTARAYVDAVSVCAGGRSSARSAGTGTARRA